MLPFEALRVHQDKGRCSNANSCCFALLWRLGFGPGDSVEDEDSRNMKKGHTDDGKRRKAFVCYGAFLALSVVAEASLRTKRDQLSMHRHG